MAYVGNSPALKYTSFAVQHFTTSATTSYSLDHAVNNENDIRLVINNVVQQPGSSYAYTASGTVLTLSAATTSSDTMYCVFLGKAVQTVNPGAGSVGTSQLATDAVTNVKVADDAIGVAELSATGTASSSTFLRGDNSWASVSDTNGCVLLYADTATTGDSELNCTSKFDSTYENYVVDVIGYQPSTAGYLLCRTGNSGGYTTSSSYNTSGFGKQDDNTDVDNYQTAGDKIYLHPTSTRSDDHLNLRMNVYIPTGVGLNKPHLFYTGVYIQNTGQKSTAFFGQGSIDSTSALTSIKFYPSTGTINDLQVKIYGFQKTV